MKVNFYATLRDIVGTKTVELEVTEGMTARDLIREVTRRYPRLARELLDRKGNLYGHVHVFINGRDLSFVEDTMEARLSAEDTINIFPAVGGG